MPDLPTVELRPAFNWTCDGCGRDHFVRAVTLPMTPEDRKEMAKVVGGTPEDYLTGAWVREPAEVACPACRATYRTVSLG